jgi:deoxyribonuclease-1
MKRIIYLQLILLSLDFDFAWSQNAQIKNFTQAKSYLYEIHGKKGFTIYCQCQYEDKAIDHESCGYKSKLHTKRSNKLEWEHVVPAHAFGQAFKSWREGHESCLHLKKNKRFKGRKCAQKIDKNFNFMEADLYNLWPAVGAINAQRSNFSMGQWQGDKGKIFGNCAVKIHQRKIEPPDSVKGLIARIYQYMDQAYPGRGVISRKNRKLFEAWDKQYPITKEECLWAEKVKKIQGNPHIIDKACQALISEVNTSKELP